MTPAELIARTREHLGIGYATFWPDAELVTNCLNPGMRLLCFLKPALYTLRTVIIPSTDEVLLDLRFHAPRLWRIQRVTLGDVSLTVFQNGYPAFPTQGRLGDLRRISLAALRGQKEWFDVQGTVPTHYYTHGLTLLGIWPRTRRPTPLTLTYAAVPPPLVLGSSVEPEIAVQWHPLISDIAACIAIMKEGRGEVENAVQRLGQHLGEEPFQQLMKTFRADQYRRQAVAAAQPMMAGPQPSATELSS